MESQRGSARFFGPNGLVSLNEAASFAVPPFTGEGGTVGREWGRSGNDVCMVEPDDNSLASIEQFFTEQGFRVVVHQEPPPEPSADALRETSSRERRARRSYRAY